jgi:hypothetical protein
MLELDVAALSSRHRHVVRNVGVCLSSLVPAPRSSPLPWTVWCGFPCRIVVPKPALGSTRPEVVRYAGFGWRGGQLD